MKYLVYLFLLGLIISCEDDDICIDGKTPQLYLKFENALETDTMRMDSIIIFRENDLGEFDLVKSIAKPKPIDSIKVSLPIEDVSQAKYIISKRTYEPMYYDTLTVNYTRELSYGSSACGYRVNYIDVYYTLTENFFVNEAILDTHITDETSPHILLYY